MPKGTFIVIDGGDGSGKATQTELLLTYLKKHKKRVKYYDFPRYETFFGSLVGRFLTGEFGTLATVSPYLISLAYAADRAQAAAAMRQWLQKGGWIVANRYTSASFAHQGAKFKSAPERAAYWKWLHELEYVQHRIPQEDIVIYLDVPSHISTTLVLHKKKRDYLGTRKTDIAEANLAHQQTARDIYLTLTKTYPHWCRIPCTDHHGQLLPLATIHEKVVQSIALASNSKQ